MISESYVPKSVLVTGGAGFIGSFVAEEVIDRFPEAVVVIFDRVDYCASINNLSCIRELPNCHFVRGDVADHDILRVVLELYKIDTVIHLAAQTHVDNSFGNSFEFTQSNVMGTHVLLEACKNFGNVRRFIHTSTDEVYGETEFGRHAPEESVLSPTNPYAASKAAGEIMARAYYYSFALPVIVLRCNNVYGPRQFPEKLIPKFIFRLRKNMKCCVHGDGLNTRNFLYVTDAARAFLSVLKHGKVGETYNIGSNIQKSVRNVAEDLLKVMDFEENESYIEYVQNRPFNDLRYVIDATKVFNLGWSPKVEWIEGLKKTVEWYSDKIEGYWREEFISLAIVDHPRFKLS